LGCLVGPTRDSPSKKSLVLCPHPQLRVGWEVRWWQWQGREEQAPRRSPMSHPRHVEGGTGRYGPPAERVRVLAVAAPFRPFPSATWWWLPNLARESRCSGGRGQRGGLPTDGDGVAEIGQRRLELGPSPAASGRRWGHHGVRW
jgi:hypothetical protein